METNSECLFTQNSSPVSIFNKQYPILPTDLEWVHFRDNNELQKDRNKRMKKHGRNYTEKKKSDLSKTESTCF